MKSARQPRDASTASDARAEAVPDADRVEAGPNGDAAPDPIRDAASGPVLDAFFIVEDAAARVCAEDGAVHEAERPGGSAQCPDDKNREGCPCTTQGARAACWPGLRSNRNHGICKDGTTTCNETVGGGLKWGPCEGYVLPPEDVIDGPQACSCFSTGTWSLSNIAPCILASPDGSDPQYLYSSRLMPGSGLLDCNAGSSSPPMPTGSWSTSALKVDCAGQYKLCYAIKAGDVSHPKPDDCTIMQTCVDTWYPEADVELQLDDLPAWTSPESASSCVAKFIDHGGYGEMTVIGKSIECDAIDDGMGAPYVFKRFLYCSPSCATTPDLPECRSCVTGSGN